MCNMLPPEKLMIPREGASTRHSAPPPLQGGGAIIEIKVSAQGDLFKLPNWGMHCRGLGVGAASLYCLLRLQQGEGRCCQRIRKPLLLFLSVYCAIP